MDYRRKFLIGLQLNIQLYFQCQRKLIYIVLMLVLEGKEKERKKERKRDKERKKERKK